MCDLVREKKLLLNARRWQDSKTAHAESVLERQSGEFAIAGFVDGSIRPRPAVKDFVTSSHYIAVFEQRNAVCWRSTSGRWTDLPVPSTLLHLIHENGVGVDAYRPNAEGLTKPETQHRGRADGGLQNYPLLWNATHLTGRLHSNWWIDRGSPPHVPAGRRETEWEK